MFFPHIFLPDRTLLSSCAALSRKNNSSYACARDLKQKAKQLAKEQGVSLNGFINATPAATIAQQETLTFFSDRLKDVGQEKVHKRVLKFMGKTRRGKRHPARTVAIFRQGKSRRSSHEIFTMVTFHYVYVLRSQKDDNNYVGYTKDLRRRITEHDDGEVPSTKNRRPLKLIYYEACLSQTDATKREKYLKSAWGKRYLKNRLQDYLTGFTP